MTSERGRVCPVHGEYAADGVCRWCEPVPSMGFDAAADDMRVAGYLEPSGINAKWGESPGARALRDVKAYADLLGPPPKLSEFRAEVAQYKLVLSEMRQFWIRKEALRWERVARRWEAKRPFRCACSETALDYLGDARMFRQDETKWKRHTTKRCDGDLINPMCQCGEWLFDAVLFRGFGQPFEKYASGLLHTPERCAPLKESTL